VVFLVPAQLIKVAIQAKPIMAAYRSATFRATPLCFFLFQELLDAMLFDEFKVLYHTHMVFCTIAFIEVFQPTTGEILAFIAETQKAFPQQVTFACHKGAVFTAWAAAGAILSRKSLHIKLVFHCQVADTHTTIHTTGSYELFFHRHNVRLQLFRVFH